MSQNRHLGDPRYKHILALLAQAVGQGMPFTVASTFVFRPGGVQYRNVFVTWAALMAARNQLDAATPVQILVDDRLAAAHMTTVGSGAPWNLDNTTLMGEQSSETFTLFIDVGAKFSSSSLTVTNGLLIKSNATSTPWVPSTFAILILDEEAQMQCVAGSAPIVHVTAPGTNFTTILRTSSTFGDGTHNVVTVDAGAETQLIAEDTSLCQAHTYGGLGTLDWDITSGSSSVTTQDIATTNIHLVARATQVAYNPADATKWVGPATTVAQALDRIAANTTNAHPIP